jgi:hypothetical protein
MKPRGVVWNLVWYGVGEEIPEFMTSATGLFLSSLSPVYWNCLHKIQIIAKRSGLY